MSLRELLGGFGDAGGSGDILVGGLALDSRKVRPGDAFVALDGSLARGIEFAPAAQAAGAIVILAEKPGGDAPAPAVSVSVPVIAVDDLRERLGAIAARFFGEPSRDLDVIGVTGTNGKTSIVQLLGRALDRAGHRVATIGTLGAGLRDDLAPGERTTPDAIAVHGLLAEFRARGATGVAMEVSSHALAQGRVNAVAFDVAVFTNLSRDHLDYHGTMDAYGEAKRRLFAWPDLGAAVVNVDDAFGREIAAGLEPAVRCLRYAIDSPDADIRASAIDSDANGLRFHLAPPWGEGDVATSLLGRYNVANLLAVSGCLGHFGLDFDAIRATLAALVPVAGRMQRLGGRDALPLVVVDYAHTPDALQQALESLRAHTAGSLTVVFGGGGERDRGKRPQMGAIAERLAGRVIVSDDNPRGESGDAIVADILAGMCRPADAIVRRDRAAAIAAAIGPARDGDVVLVAGKGHEPYQEVAGVRHRFDDARVVARILEAQP